MSHYLGLMSGTSLDGVDLVWVTVDEVGSLDPPWRVEVRRFETRPFPAAMRDCLLKVIGEPSITAPELIALHHRLGALFAEMTAAFLAELPIDVSAISALGMHGVTWWHQPDAVAVGDGVGRGTMQLGDPNLVAQATGLRVITDFRHADMALGGQGAPLAPFIDHMCFRDAVKGRILLNLGGIANLTFLPAGSEVVVAFDSGPSNMIMDALMRRHPLAPAEFDDGGRRAASGRVIPALLDACLADPYFARQPPKSTGREHFGDAYLQRFLDHPFDGDDDDLVTTAAHLTARTVIDAVRGWTGSGYAFRHFHELYVSGGGAHNQYLLGLLAAGLPELAIQPLSALGFDVDAKEAALMALLARARLLKLPANFPSVTGASRKTTLGVIVGGDT